MRELWAGLSSSPCILFPGSRLEEQACFEKGNSHGRGKSVAFCHTVAKSSVPLPAVAGATRGHISLAKASHMARPDTDGPRKGHDYGPCMGHGDVEVEIVIQFSRSVVSNSVTPWTAARQASLSITNSQSPPKLMSIESVMPSNHLILCRPLLLLPSIFPSIRVFSNESALHIRWLKYWSFQLQHQSFQ